MRVGLVVAANKYTGAAAVAEHCCRALRTAGVDARLLFGAGRNLEPRLAAEPWALAGLAKERSPSLVLRNLAALRQLGAGNDVVITHLPHDHVLAMVAGVHRRAVLVRSFRNPRHLRRDPWHRALARPLDGCLLAHSAMANTLLALAPGLPHLALPVPVEARFAPVVDSGRWRRRLGIPDGAPVLGMVGKVAAGRGFDLLLAAAARTEPCVHVLAVGHGEARPGLERLALHLGIGDRLHWAGYQDTALPELLATMTVVLFVAPGSDHGHRAISEAQACGRPVVAARLDGVEDLIADGDTGILSPADPDALAAAVSGVLQDGDRARRLADAAARAVAVRRFAPSGERLARFLEGVVAGRAATTPGVASD